MSSIINNKKAKQRNLCETLLLQYDYLNQATWKWVKQSECHLRTEDSYLVQFSNKPNALKNMNNRSLKKN